MFSSTPPGVLYITTYIRTHKYIVQTIDIVVYDKYSQLKMAVFG